MIHLQELKLVSDGRNHGRNHGTGTGTGWTDGRGSRNSYLDINKICSTNHNLYSDTYVFERFFHVSSRHVPISVSNSGTYKKARVFKKPFFEDA